MLCFHVRWNALCLNHNYLGLFFLIFGYIWSFFSGEVQFSMFCVFMLDCLRHYFFFHIFKSPFLGLESCFQKSFPPIRMNNRLKDIFTFLADFLTSISFYMEERTFENVKNLITASNTLYSACLIFGWHFQKSFPPIRMKY